MCQETLLAFFALVTGMSGVVVVHGYFVYVHVPAFDVESLGGLPVKLPNKTVSD